MSRNSSSSSFISTYFLNSTPYIGWRTLRTWEICQTQIPDKCRLCWKTFFTTVLNFPTHRHRRCRFRPPQPSDFAFGGYVSALRRCAYNSFRRRSPWCQTAENWQMWRLLQFTQLLLGKINKLLPQTTQTKLTRLQQKLTERIRTNPLTSLSSHNFVFFNCIHIFPSC